MKKKRLGEVLRERNQVSADDLNKATQDQQGKLVLGELLLQGGIVSKDHLVSALAEASRIPYVDCASISIDDSTLCLFPAAMASRCCAVPLTGDGTKLVVAMAEPQNLQLLDELRFKCGMIIEPRLGFRAELESAIERFYGPTDAVVIATQDSSHAPRRRAHAPNEGEMEFISFSSQERNVEAMRETQSELMQKSKTTPAVMVVASLIKAAAERRASDIHIEPQSDGTAVIAQRLIWRLCTCHKSIETNPEYAAQLPQGVIVSGAIAMPKKIGTPPVSASASTASVKSA